MNEDLDNTNTPPPEDMAEKPTDTSDASQIMMDVDDPDTNPGTKRSLVDDEPFTLVENREKKKTKKKVPYKPPMNSRSTPSLLPQAAQVPKTRTYTKPPKKVSNVNPSISSKTGGTGTSKILPDPPQANPYILLQTGGTEASEHSDEQ